MASEQVEPRGPKGEGKCILDDENYQEQTPFVPYGQEPSWSNTSGYNKPATSHLQIGAGHASAEITLKEIGLCRNK